MARRIALPSTDQLFSDAAPYAASATGDAAEGARPARTRRVAAKAAPAASPQAPPTTSPPRARAAAPKPAVTAEAPRPVRRVAPRGVAARIDDVETRLRDLPIDTLLSLRDGLEALLIAGPVSEQDVERVLTGW